MAWTTDDLLVNIKNRQMFPDASTGSLSSAALLQYATDELYITILPVIMGIRERFYETLSDYVYSTTSTSIPIPNRSIGNTVSAVQFIYGQAIVNLNPIDPSIVSTTQPSSSPANFYFQNNSVVPYPQPAASYGTIRLRYFQRPSRLAQTSACAQITAFNAGTGVATCTVPTAWTTSNIFDFVPQAASQATPYNLGVSASSLTSSSITFTLTAAQAALVSVGDWISLAEYTPIPEIPFELQSVLAQATCVRALSAIGDDKVQLAAKDLQAYLAAAVKLLNPRDQAGAKKVISMWRWW